MHRISDDKNKRITRIVTLCVSFVLFVALIIGLLNLKSFLEDYYQNKKINAMIEAYSQINTASKEGNFNSEEFDITFQNICEKNNVNIVILDSRTQTLKASSREYEDMTKDLLGYIFGKSTMADDVLINQNAKYEVHYVTDPKNGGEYLDMWGVMDDGNIFLIRSPMEGIRESVRISNDFFSYIFLALVFLLILILVIQWRRVSVNELRIKNEQLRHDIEQKEKLEQMRSEFLSNVSHELKTPISLIQGYAEGLTESVNSDEESRNFYCEVIMDEASKMNNMVKKLLDIDHLEFGDADFRFEKFDVVEMVKGYLQSAAILISQKNVSVVFNNDEPVYVYADEYYAQEVFNNYFTNALNHVSGQMEIRISVMKSDDCVTISIFNAGDPIPNDSVTKIWDKFYKVDKARTREYGGSGVGLSIVKAIQESIGQSYGFENYSDGVRFYYTLKAFEEEKQ